MAEPTAYQQKVEAVRRMKEIGFEREFYLASWDADWEPWVYSQTGGMIPFKWIPHEVLIQLEAFEERFHGFVYLITYNETAVGTLWTCFYVSKHREEWEDDFDLIQDGEQYCFVINEQVPEFSEIGLIGFEFYNNAVIRTE